MSVVDDTIEPMKTINIKVDKAYAEDFAGIKLTDTQWETLYTNLQDSIEWFIQEEIKLIMTENQI